MVAIDTAGKTLWQLVEERAAVTPDARMARDEAGRTLTFGEYHQWCLRAAAGFHDLGVNEGSNVSWVLPSRFESLVLAGALARLGAVQNPILPIYRHREVGFITRQSHCSMLVVPGTFRGFHYPDMAAEALQGLDATIVVADPDLPTGDPASLPPYRAALDELALAIKKDCGADIETAEIDLRDIPKLNMILADLIRKMGPVRVLVNNAGNDDRVPWDQVTPTIGMTVLPSMCVINSLPHRRLLLPWLRRVAVRLSILVRFHG